MSIPPASLFGKKKKAGNPDGLLRWLKTNLSNCDSLVVSLEMILYGGLLPSRLHHTSYGVLSRRLKKFFSIIRLRKKQGGKQDFRVYVFGLVMRTPAYSSDDEEPDYYARFGKEIFRRAYLSHKEEIEGLTRNETRELQKLEEKIPDEIRRDYEGRRNTNRRLLQDTMQYFAKGEIDVLLIPQDDTARYGYGPRDWSLLFSQFGVAEGSRAGNLLSYPGADEVGGVLVARSVLDWYGSNGSKELSSLKADTNGRDAIRVFTLPRAPKDMERIPKYESMVLAQSVRHQIQSCGGVEVRNPDDAHIILAVNTPANDSSEASIQEFRNSFEFVKRIAEYSSRHSLPVIVADTAYPNGGETSFLHELERQGLWNRLLSYAGWNTAGNSLGTALYTGVLSYLAGDVTSRLENLYYRVCDDWAYQSILRTSFISRLSDESSAGHVDISSLSNAFGLQSELVSQLNDLMEAQFPALSVMAGFKVAGVDFPWDRLFEIRLELLPVT